MTILACIDGSRYAPAVCAYAARVARRLGAGITVLHAIEPADQAPTWTDRSGLMTANMTEATLERFTRLNEERNRIAQEHGRALLDQAAEQVRGHGATVDRELLVFGSLVDAIHEHDAGARFVVLGRRGEAEARASAHLGSNLERVVRASRHPVLIVPPEYRPLERFIVAYDGSASSEKAITMLTSETLLQEASCRLLLVGQDDAAHRATLAGARSRLEAVGYRVESVIRSGDPEPAIVQEVREWDADLLVMGAYGHSRIRELIIGSTTTALLRDSPVPLLVVR